MLNLRHYASPAWLLLPLLCAGFACDGKSPPPPPPNKDGGGLDHDGGGPVDPWSREVIDTGGMGKQISVAVGPSDEGRISYFAMQATDDGDCTEIPLNPPRRQRWKLRFAEEGAGSWNTEDVFAPLYVGAPGGAELRTAPGGNAVIATMIGDPLPTLLYCGVNDLGLMERTAPGSWTPTTVVMASGEAVTGEPASDYGDVVGYWASLAYDSAGSSAMAYKDVHAGSLQGDDYKRADLEVAFGGAGGSRAVAVDWGQGAGNYNAIAFDGKDQPVVAYHVPTESLIGSRHGVWASRSLDKGATWERVQLLAGGTAPRISIAIDPAGLPAIAFYSGPEFGVRLARQVDDAKFTDIALGWTLTKVGKATYDEGYHPSIAFDPAGHLAMAYYRCVRINRGTGSCDPNDDGVVFAWQDGEFWEYELIDEGGAGNCGMSPSLAFDSTGRAIVGYQCTDQVAGKFEFQVKIATREPLL